PPRRSNAATRPWARPRAARRSCRSWQRQLLLQLGRADLLAVARLAALEAPRVRELADDDGIETGVAHQAGRRLHRLGLVARDRHRKLRIGSVRLLGEDANAHGVERAHDFRAGQIFLRHHADAVALHLVGKLLPVAAGNRVAGVEHDLALEAGLVLLADL